MNITYKQSESNSKFLQPTGGGSNVIDVLTDMAWTLSPKYSRRDVPYIKLKEYQQTTGQLIAAIIYYGRVFNKIVRGNNLVTGQDDATDVYKFKYFAEPTGFNYKFPYFNSKKITRGNTFGQEDNPFSGVVQLGERVRASAAVVGRGVGGGLGIFYEVAALGQAGIGVANTIVPGKIGFEFPKSWDSSDLETVEVSFDLFNSNNVNDIKNNRNLCYILSYQNTPSRRNFSLIDPPAIYSLDIPDVVSLPACYMSSLDIKNLGNTRLMNIGDVTRTVPEAYRISMTFTSLLMPTRNILDAMDKGQTVEAISDITPFQDFTNAYVDYSNQLQDDIAGPVDIKELQRIARTTPGGADILRTLNIPVN